MLANVQAQSQNAQQTSNQAQYTTGNQSQGGNKDNNVTDVDFEEVK